MPAGPPDPSPVELLQLVGDPQRWHLLRLLGESDQRVGDLVELTGRAQNVISYHLGGLRAIGLVSSRRSAADGRDSYYRVDLERYGALVGEAVTALHPGLQVTPIDPPPVPIRGRGRAPRVLFLCTGNSARSQIAEALVEAHAGRAVRASSAGSHPKPLHPNAVRVLAERGIDISRRRTKHLDRFRDTEFDRVVTLCDKVREVCPELPGAPRAAHWSMADPAAGGDDEATYPTFVALADEIDARVRVLLAQLAQEPTVRDSKESTHAHR